MKNAFVVCWTNHYKQEWTTIIGEEAMRSFVASLIHSHNINAEDHIWVFNLQEEIVL